MDGNLSFLIKFSKASNFHHNLIILESQITFLFFRVSLLSYVLVVVFLVFMKGNIISLCFVLLVR